MAENLDYGTQISASSTQAAGGAAQKYCYQNDATNCVKYGGLYQWATAMALDASCNTSSCTGVTNQQGLCPVDWHIPTLADLGVLYLGTTTSGPHLQSQIGWEGWEGDNSTGFSALPGGIHDPVDGWVLGWDYYSSGTFSGIASFISAAETAGAPLKASVRVVTISSYWGGDYSKMTANSIRCVKNTP